MSRLSGGSWASGDKVPPGPIVVIGSINMDLVCRVPRMPAGGETILGSEVSTVPGGKGANQAVAASKLGAQVHLIGRVGDDDFGSRHINCLQQHKVNTDNVTVTEGTSSGCALILVDKKGENSIVVAAGANAKLRPADIDAAEGLLATASVVLMQLEIPIDTVQHAIATCRKLGVFTILDPAPVPVRGAPKELFGVNVLTPNQREAEALLPLGQMGRMRRKKRVDAKQIGTELLSRGPQSVVLKLGPRGAMIQDQGGYIQTIKGLKVSVVDTTAAGDAFAGALAVSLSEGKDLREAVQFANAAGAACCRGFGAQPSLPSREQVEKLLFSRR
jgi:ribokinase